MMSCVTLVKGKLGCCQKQCSRACRAKCRKWIISKYQSLRRRG